MYNPQKSPRRLVALLTVGLLSLPASFLSCGAETAGEAIRFNTAVQGALEGGRAVEPFETARGWTVTLERAYATFGPIYFYGGAAMACAPSPFGGAYACPTHAQYDYGAVLGEVLSQYAVDLLAEAPTTTGQVEGALGTCQSVELHLHPPGDPRLTAGSSAEAFAPLDGLSILLEGVATSGEDTVPFRAKLDVPDEGTMRIVQNIASDIELDDTDNKPGSLVVQVLVDAWLDQVDFASLTEADTDGRRLFTEGTQARAALLQAVRNRYAYQVKWSAP